MGLSWHAQLGVALLPCRPLSVLPWVLPVLWETAEVDRIELPYLWLSSSEALILWLVWNFKKMLLNTLSSTKVHISWDLSYFAVWGSTHFTEVVSVPFHGAGGKACQQVLEGQVGLDWKGLALRASWHGGSWQVAVSGPCQRSCPFNVDPFLLPIRFECSSQCFHGMFHSCFWRIKLLFLKVRMRSCVQIINEIWFQFLHEVFRCVLYGGYFMWSINF